MTLFHCFQLQAAKVEPHSRQDLQHQRLDQMVRKNSLNILNLIMNKFLQFFVDGLSVLNYLF